MELRDSLAILIFIIGIALGIWLGGYLMFFKGIVQIIDTIKNGNWETTIIAWGIVKIVFGGTVAGIIIYITGFFASSVVEF